MSYRLITTDDPAHMFREGEVRFFDSMLDAANAFATETAPYKTVLYDDGCQARELDGREQRLLEKVCDLHGLEIGELDAR